MSAYPTIAPPGTLGDALAPIAVLSDTDFNAFVRATSSPRSFSLTPTQIKELSAEIPTLRNYLPYILGILSFLYSEIDSLGELGDTYKQVVNKVIDDLKVKTQGPEQRDQLQSRLEILLKKNTENVRFKKLNRLQKGFVPNATSFRSMVDLRPDFGDGEAVEYQGLLKIIQFRVTTDSDDPRAKEMVFQLSEESLAELMKALERLKLKLDSLKAQSDLAAQFLKVQQ